MNSSQTSFLRALCRLRWLTVAGQTATVLIANGPMGLNLTLMPLWFGIAALTAFNLFAQTQLRQATKVSPLMAFSHILVDISILAWMVGWSGGIDNPFGSLFLVLIALAALALPLRWSIAVAVLCVTAYGLTAMFGVPLPHSRFNPLSLMAWGMGINFLLSTVVMLVFASQLVIALRKGEREIARLRERAARNEGIVALATHAASVAHELNTPLATMTLLADDIDEHCQHSEWHDDLQTLRDLLKLCHERVLALAAPADRLDRQVSMSQILEQWRLIHPTIQLNRQVELPEQLMLEPAVGHLFIALLNNAADASEIAGRPWIDLQVTLQDGVLYGDIRDYGHGLTTHQETLPQNLFQSSKPKGMGVGLALSQATVERLNGKLWTIPVDGPGLRVGLRLTLGETAQ